MATTAKNILQRTKFNIEKIKDKETKKLFKDMIEELQQNHQRHRNDILAAEQRLDDGGL